MNNVGPRCHIALKENTKTFLSDPELLFVKDRVYSWGS